MNIRSHASPNPFARAAARHLPLACLALACALAAVPAGAADKATAMAQTGTRFKADRDMQTVLDALAAMNPQPIETLSAEEARRQPTMADAVKSVLAAQGKSTEPTALVPGIASDDRQIPGAAGPLSARVYTPAGGGPFPVILYLHGGGWVIADKDVYDGGARGLAQAAGAIVVSVDYRRAPEAKFPAAWDDSLAAYRWITANAGSINGTRQFAIAGESAGGNLAIATAIAARDAGLPKPLAIVAVYPVGQTGDMATPSYADSATAKPLNRAMIGWFLDKLLASPGDKTDPRLDLVHANLAVLPPVTLVNAPIDPLRSDGELLQAALRKAGVPVERKVYSGVTHEFFGAAAVVAKARLAQAYAGQRLRSVFGY